VAVSAGGEPALLSVTDAVAAIHSGRLSAVELTEAVLRRVEQSNRELNAYLHVDGEAALEQARRSDASGARGELQGIPLCVKDLIDVAGVPTTAGAGKWRRLPVHDAVAVSRLRAAGAVIVGKGHTTEFAYGIDGRNPHFGDCRNPIDPRRLAGGSSSGPAVATATGLASAGLGSDTSGSIRVPAALCGLVGVRITPGAVPLTGVVPLAWSYDTVGPLTRTVSDAAILTRVLMDGGGSDERGSSLWSMGGPRLGVLEQLVEAAEDYVQVELDATTRHLEAKGARVVPVRLDNLRHVAAMHHLIQQAEAAQVHTPWFEDQRPYYSPPIRLRLQAGRLLPASAYLTAQQARRLFIDEVASAMAGLDALLAPAAPVVAPFADAESVTVRGQSYDIRTALLACPMPASQLACPVVAVPIGTHEGLPLGMQIIGRPFTEPALLSIAGASEERVR
jgi:aspartyl-tRNA(Asn)/glutamyl-tRNA(Gln) amidotransferase subunit A